MHDLLISLGVLAGLGVLFLVIISSLNKSVDYLSRVVFLLKTEYDYRAEELEVRQVLAAMEDEEY